MQLMGEDGPGTTGLAGKPSVPSKPAGHKFKACCPFHDENTPSFKMFYCNVARSGNWLMQSLSISRLLLKVPLQCARAGLHTETGENGTTVLHAPADLAERISDASMGGPRDGPCPV